MLCASSNIAEALYGGGEWSGEMIMSRNEILRDAILAKIQAESINSALVTLLVQSDDAGREKVARGIIELINGEIIERLTNIIISCNEY